MKIPEIRDGRRRLQRKTVEPQRARRKKSIFLRNGLPCWRKPRSLKQLRWFHKSLRRKRRRFMPLRETVECKSLRFRNCTMEEFKAEDLPAEPVSPAEPLVAAHQDTGRLRISRAGGSEEETGTDWSSLPQTQACQRPRRTQARAGGREIGQHHKSFCPEKNQPRCPCRNTPKLPPKVTNLRWKNRKPPCRARPPQPEFELDQDFELVMEPEEVVPAHEMLSQIPVQPAPARALRKPRAEGEKSRTGAPANHVFLRSVPFRSGERNR